ncbi:MAG: DUF2784 domain-containing protein [Terriglobales bacterium]
MAHLWRILADCVLGLHLLFLLWVIFGAFAVRKRPWLRWLHIACLVWGVLVEVTPWPCPLTLLENWLEFQGKVEPYSGGFLLHYLDKLVYPDISPTLLTVAGVLICVLNLGFYGRALFLHLSKSR